MGNLDKDSYNEGYADAKRDYLASAKDTKVYGRDIKPEDLGRVITEFVNGRSSQGKKVAEAITNEHRTLQNLTFGLCVDIVTALAELPDSRIDMRNEQTRELARKMIEATGGAKPWLV